MPLSQQQQINERYPKDFMAPYQQSSQTDPKKMTRRVSEKKINVID
jgi:hypothetical protein